MPAPQRPIGRCARTSTVSTEPGTGTCVRSITSSGPNSRCAAASWAGNTAGSADWNTTRTLAAPKPSASVVITLYAADAPKITAAIATVTSAMTRVC
jgi:hypothetical protein